MRKKTVIIGGVAGGATTAARIRRNDEIREIIILEKGDYVSYANCGLPYYIGDVIKKRSALFLQTPKSLKEKYNIDVRVANEVIQIVPEQKKVIVKNTKTMEMYHESYDELVIATGSSPLKPPIEGINSEGIFTLWNVADTDAIKEFIAKETPKHAVVVGGGFIGLEMAENLHAVGINVSIIEMQEQVMAPLDFEMAKLLHENIIDNGVDLHLSDGVATFAKKETKIVVCLKSGVEILTDMVVLSIGIKPNSQLTEETGILRNERGGIQTDTCLKTSIDDIYAVGDVIEVEHFVSREKTMVPLAGPANKQGRLCADTICGIQKPYRGSMGTSVAKVFDLHAAGVGLNEKTLRTQGKEKGKDYESVIIVQKSHAGYYPHATSLTLKITFSVEGKVLGAQVVGQEGVDKRIDVLATVISLKGSIKDLTELELAYAPPFSSAKDPVNMLGFVAENILEKKVFFTTYKEVDELIESHREKEEKPYIILDVTEEMERIVFAMETSVSIPLGTLRERIKELSLEKQIIVYCAIGIRSYNAARILMQNGFKNVKVLEGGSSFYKSMHAMDLKRNRREKMVIEETTTTTETRNLDCSGLQCPGPIMKVNEMLSTMANGETLKVSATDLGFAKDIEAWCRRTGNIYLTTEKGDKEQVVYLQKGIGECPISKESTANGKTIIVFSGDLDKVLASFIIANGAAAMGRKVTMFFTFWGLNALRKNQKVNVKKSIVEKMFGMMMPRGSKKLKLSNMNMAGMGTSMMKRVMKDKNVDSLEALMQKAMESGIRLVACTMSMDVMGITKEELLDGVELAGVASYLGDAEESNVNLFI